MKSNDFSVKLTTKFPDLLSKNSGELGDIMDYVGRIPEAALDNLWAEFRDTFTVSRSPRRADFVTIGKTLGIVRSEAEKQREFVCYVCGARYPLTGLVCPNCRNDDKAWRAVIDVGAYRSGKLRKEIEEEREQAFASRMGVKS